MARSDLWPISVWRNGRYARYDLFGREIASGPSFEIGREYIRDLVAKPTATVLDRLRDEGWTDRRPTPDLKKVLTNDGRTVKIGVGFLGRPARFIRDGERYNTPDELFDALSK